MEYVFNKVGAWQSIEDLEENVTLEQLHRMFLTQQRIEHQTKSFEAAINGVQLDPYEDPDYDDVTTFEELKQRVAAKQQEAMRAAGVTTSSHPELEAMGLTVEEY